MKICGRLFANDNFVWAVWTARQAGTGMEISVQPVWWKKDKRMVEEKRLSRVTNWT
jgi:hypothetical protein